MAADRFRIFVAAVVALCLVTSRETALASDDGNPPVHAEVVVYGGTPSGVMAAVAAARHGHTVALIDLNAHVGGMISGGLVATDIGDRKTVGGLADDFFQRIVKYYTMTYGADSKELKACRNGLTFEPHAAEIVFEQMLKEQPGITLYRNLRYQSVTLDGNRSTPVNRLISLTVQAPADGAARTFTADLFIDASYEGDVMADERTETTPFNFTPLGEFRFKAGESGYVEITNGNTDGYVVVDGVRWIWLGE
jgi:NADPH-dependent 2,4-dienoyl-CoA reductase/sulfur reductase-like enzyme